MKLEETERLFIESLVKKTIDGKKIEDQTISRIEKLTGDASTRRYYRVICNINAYVACLDQPRKGDCNFTIMQKLLEENEVRVPRIYDYDAEKGYILEEDLGDRTLLIENSRLISPTEELKRYKEILDSLIRLHQIKIENSSADYSKLSFNTEKLAQEIEFTKEFFINSFLGIKLNRKEQEIHKSFFNEICENIAKEEMVLTHRDFHSRNIMCKSGEYIIIDFQDARRGIPQYDLVSLLEDCYYQLRPQNIDILKRYYWDNFKQVQKAQKNYQTFNALYEQMAIQRVYKAIGSFSYIYKSRGDHRYIKYIGFGMEKLRHLLMNIENHDEFKQMLYGYYYVS